VIPKSIFVYIIYPSTHQPYMTQVPWKPHFFNSVTSWNLWADNLQSSTHLAVKWTFLLNKNKNGTGKAMWAPSGGYGWSDSWGSSTSTGICTYKQYGGGSIARAQRITVHTSCLSNILWNNLISWAQISWFDGIGRGPVICGFQIICNVTEVNKYLVGIINSWIALPTIYTKLNVQQI